MFLIIYSVNVYLIKKKNKCTENQNAKFVVNFQMGEGDVSHKV